MKSRLFGRGHDRTSDRLTGEVSKGQLREFVYLDEVSLYSLLASVRGGITSEFTDTLAKSLESEIAGSLGGGAILKAEVSSRIQAESSSGRQVVSKAIIQSHFGELHESVKSSLAMQAVAGHRGDRLPHSEEEFREFAADGKGHGICREADLSRGVLVELDVELDTAPIFRFLSMMAVVVDLARDAPSMLGFTSQQLGEMVVLYRVMEQLLVGLVPVQGRVIGYEVVEIGTDRWMVPTTTVDDIENIPEVRVTPLYLTAVVERSLFWRDTRRVLFDKSRFRVLARLAADGAHDTWTPVKLVDVFRGAVPGFEESLSNVDKTLLTAFAQDEADRISDLRSRWKEALNNYGLSTAAASGLAVAAEALEEVIGRAMVSSRAELGRSHAERMAMFGAVTLFIEAQLGSPVSKEVAAGYRASALQDAGLTVDGQVDGPTESVTSVADGLSKDALFLDSEMIAIYW